MFKAVQIICAAFFGAYFTRYCGGRQMLFLERLFYVLYLFDAVGQGVISRRFSEM